MAAHPERSLELERIVPAPPSVAFSAVTDSDQLRRWWGPKGFTIPSVDFEPEVGSGYRIEMQPPEGDRFYLSGEFRELDPPTRLAFTFVWEDPDPDDVENVVRLSFRDLDRATEVRLVQRPFKTDARLDLHRDGWTDSFDKLEALLAERG